MKDSTKLLQTAKDLLQKVGWCKRAYCLMDASDNCIGYCSSGALFAAANPKFSLLYKNEPIEPDLSNNSFVIINPALDEARAALMQAIPPGEVVLAWNDDPNTTKEMVLAAFDKAIKINEQ